jgi:hypothetical protein
MSQNYIVSLTRTSFSKGIYEENTYDFEYYTYEEALLKYEKEAMTIAHHLTMLTHIKVDAIIKVINTDGNIVRKINMSN